MLNAVHVYLIDITTGVSGLIMVNLEAMGSSVNTRKVGAVIGLGPMTLFLNML